MQRYKKPYSDTYNYSINEPSVFVRFAFLYVSIYITISIWKALIRFRNCKKVKSREYLITSGNLKKKILLL